MTRLLFMLVLVLAAVTLAVLLANALAQTGRTGAALIRRDMGELTMQKIAFAALIVLLVGVTSGLIGGL